MNANRVRQLSAVLMLAAGVVLGSVAMAEGANPTPPELLQQIQNAKTPADHQAIAAYYEREAAKARGWSENHREIAAAYGGPQRGVKSAGQMQAHCKSVADSYAKIATEYDALAASHREMAKQAKP